MNRDREMQRSRRPVPRWLPEMLLVLVSAGLGFGAAQYGEYRDDRLLASRITEGIMAELAENRARLEPLVPLHAAWAETLRSARPAPNQAGLDVWFAARPPLPQGVKSPFATLRRSAWDAAIAGNSLRLLDFEITTALSAIYRAQDIVTDNVGRLASGALSQTATYDPASRDASVRLLWLTLADIHAAEAMLLELYEQHSTELRRLNSATSSK